MTYGAGYPTILVYTYILYLIDILKPAFRLVPENQRVAWIIYVPNLFATEIVWDISQIVTIEIHVNRVFVCVLFPFWS